jgi:signal transduction histidine kinase
VINSKMLIKSWVFVDSKSDTPDKIRLMEIHDIDFDAIVQRLNILSSDWPDSERTEFTNICTTIKDTLFVQHQYVMGLLNSFERYHRPAVMFEAMSMVEEDNDEIMFTTQEILDRLNRLVTIQDNKVLQAKEQVRLSFTRFRALIIALGIMITLTAIFTAILTINSIIRPIRLLKHATQEVAEENYDVQVLLDGEDELQVLADAFNQMTSSLKISRENLQTINANLENERIKLEEANNALQQSEQMLREAKECQQRIFAIVAHDLKNSFSSLFAITHMLSKEFNTIEQEERVIYLDRMKHSTEKLYGLMENLLQWAGSQSGKFPFNPGIIDLREVILASFSVLKESAEKKSIRLESAVIKPLMIYADRDMILAVFRNLVNNAIKFSLPGGCVLLFSNAGHEEVEVSVKDEGIGMSETEIRKLFRLDVPAKSIGNSSEKGSGLGLIVCHDFVQKHKGFITVESEPGKGSTFKLIFPRLKELQRTKEDSTIV